MVNTHVLEIAKPEAINWQILSKVRVITEELQVGLMMVRILQMK
jgi:hypothetical protein